MILQLSLMEIIFVVLEEEKRKEEEPGIILLSEGGMGLLWYAKKMYHNFVLRLDWKTQFNNTCIGRGAIICPVYLRESNRCKYKNKDICCTN